MRYPKSANAEWRETHYCWRPTHSPKEWVRNRVTTPPTFIPDSLATIIIIHLTLFCIRPMARSGVKQKIKCGKEINRGEKTVNVNVGRLLIEERKANHRLYLGLRPAILLSDIVALNEKMHRLRTRQISSLRLSQ
jgi:hypothetical protein